jgi:predicted transcriptional regulator
MGRKKHAAGSLGDRIVYYLDTCGPAYAKKLAEITRAAETEVRRALKRLDNKGLIQRVTAAEVTYREGGATITKSRNHTYFEITRKGRRVVRNMDEAPDVNLTPVYKRSGKG